MPISTTAADMVPQDPCSYDNGHNKHIIILNL